MHANRILQSSGLLFIFGMLIGDIEDAAAQSPPQYVHDSAKVSGGFIHYYTKGKGKQIVLLPGGPGYSSYYMRDISDSLQGYKTILIDFRGTGHSRYKKADSTWVNQDNMVQDVELLRQHLGVGKWTVLGHSWATHTALYYAIKHPQHTEKTILIATAGTDNSFLKYYSDNIRMQLTEQDMAEMDSLSKLPSRNSLEISKVWFRGYFYDHDKASLLFANVPEEEIPYLQNDEFFNAFVHNPHFKTFDIGEQAYALDLPVRIIQGRQDPVNGGTQERLNERLKHSRIFYIERAGHFPWLEQPEAFFNALRKSLSEE